MDCNLYQTRTSILLNIYWVASVHTRYIRSLSPWHLKCPHPTGMEDIIHSSDNLWFSLRKEKKNQNSFFLKQLLLSHGSSFCSSFSIYQCLVVIQTRGIQRGSILYCHVKGTVRGSRYTHSCFAIKSTKLNFISHNFKWTAFNHMFSFAFHPTWKKSESMALKLSSTEPLFWESVTSSWC